MAAFPYMVWLCPVPTLRPIQLQPRPSQELRSATACLRQNETWMRRSLKVGRKRLIVGVYDIKDEALKGEAASRAKPTYLNRFATEMEKRLEEKLRISQKEKESSNSSRSPLKTTMVIQDNSLPAAPAPQIRILKRPSSNGSLGSPLNQNRPTPQVKSLAQREAEYAEARKRILGSACPEETPQDKPNTDRPGRNNSTLPSEDSRPNSHTVRQPAGPDGTQGFRQHR